MRHLLTALLALCALGWATSAHAAEGDLVYSSGSNKPQLMIHTLCTVTTGDCAEFDLKTNANRMPKWVTFALESEAGGTCSVAIKARDITGTGERDLVTLTSADTSESRDYRGWWRYVYATVTGSCTTLNVTVKRIF